MKTTKTLINENEPASENISLKELNKADNPQENNLTIKVFPSAISDEDITSLFLGLVRVVKKKIELDNRATILNLNITNENLQKQLKAKQTECNRLKNEIIYLKSKLNN